MKLDIIKSKGLDIEWRITVPSRDLSPKFEEEYLNLSKNVKLSGFRPGKVPLEIVKQKYAQNVTQKILDEVINFSLRKTAAEKKIQPSIQPKVKVEKYEEGGDLIFSAVFQIMPEVPDIDLKKIEVEKSELLMDEKDIDKTLQELAKNHERFEPLKTKRKSKKGDLILFDFEGKINNKEFKGSSGKDETVVLGSKKYIPGYEEQMENLQIGQESEINVVFPDDYREKGLAKKKARFNIKIKDIQERVKDVALDDKLAKELGEENLVILKEKVKEKMINDFNKFSVLKMRRELTDIILNKLKFDVPSGMIADEKVFLNNQNNNQEKKLSNDEIEKMSKRRVKLGLILNSIGKKNNIEINDKDLTKAVVNEAQKYPGDEKKVVDFYKQNPKMMDNLRGIAFEEKVMDFLINSVSKKIKKSTFDELFKSDKLKSEKELVKKKTKEK
ncbi:trigger factor [Alphaproteobacteria bacterium]|nr:trigger factor [Alphaproteobacteria bacterium]